MGARDDQVEPNVTSAAEQLRRVRMRLGSLADLLEVPRLMGDVIALGVFAAVLLGGMAWSCAQIELQDRRERAAEEARRHRRYDDEREPSYIGY